MKQIFIIFFSTLLIGCNGRDTETSVGVGVGIGGGSGGVGVGTGVGVEAPISNSYLSANERENISKNSPETLEKIDDRNQLSIQDIKTMTNAGVTDDKIISIIRSTGSVFYLSSSDVRNLRSSGVSKRVIDYMLQTPYQ